MTSCGSMSTSQRRATSFREREKKRFPLFLVPLQLSLLDRAPNVPLFMLTRMRRDTCVIRLRFLIEAPWFSLSLSLSRFPEWKEIVEKQFDLAERM